MTATFDALAAGYDADFTHTPLGRALRGMTWEHLDAAFSPGTHVLELTCGTGEDALHLAERGVHVTASDASAQMLNIASEKITQAKLTDHVQFEVLDLNHLPSILPSAPFEGVYSNFGGLNCVTDLPALAQLLASALPPGAKAVFVVMGPYCPWEWAWFLARLRPGTAFRRLRKTAVVNLHGTASFPVYYPSPRQLTQAFAPYFSHRNTYGIGTVLPPSYAGNWLNRRPDLLHRLHRIDASLSRFPPFAWLSDHYLIALEKQ